MARKALVFTILFFCSGATALVYEVVWSKYLSQLFGSTIHAQTVVLAVFMGGLALGNTLFGSRADRLKTPMRIYAVLEIAIGVYAFAFTAFYGFANTVFVKLGSSLISQPWILLALKGLLSVALLLGPTVLMGGTLPLLAAWLNNHVGDAGRRSALFYAVNSLGAVLGAALAGFYLVRNFGMVLTLQITGLVNVLVGAAAIGLSKPAQLLEQSEIKFKSANSALAGHSKGLRLASYLVATTGAISMGLEVLASRSLALIFGSSLQAFAVVLIAFILGIGLGSVWISRGRTPWRSQMLIVGLLLSAAAWVGLLVFNIENWVEFYRWAVTGVGRTPTGYTFHHLLTGFMSVVLLGVPAALLGSVLPLQIRASASDAGALGRDVGRLLTWNTLGAVVGVIITGFLIMPGAGLRSAFVILALLLCVAAGVYAWRLQLQNQMIWSGGIALALLFIFPIGGEGWRHVMSSGVFRAREKVVDPTIMEMRKQHVKILFYEDSPDATVAVEEGDGIAVRKDRTLSLNGKADASTRGDLGTQLLIGHLPLLSKPGSKDVFILGLGSGITAGAVVSHPVDTLTIAENCEPVIRAARFFDEWNHGVLTNPVTRIWREDARTILHLDPRRYDVIITQPSNPWMAGNGSVFSREFYQLAASRLKPGGLVAQWFQVYDMDDGIISLVLRTFSQTFPFVEIWDTGSGDIILLGGQQAWPSRPENYQEGFRHDLVRRGLERIGIRTPEALLARQLASQRTGFAIAGEGLTQSDNFPILEYDAPLAFFIGANSRVLCQFDERTVQFAAAPMEKRTALEALDEKQLKEVFAEYGTINPELKDQLRARLDLKSNRRGIPGVFAKKEANPQPDPIPSNVGPEVRELLTACSLLETSRKSEGVDRIIQLLKSRGAQSDWSAGHYAMLAARASLALGNSRKAAEIVELGRSQPTPELLYLDRVLQREQALERSQLSSAK